MEIEYPSGNHASDILENFCQPLPSVSDFSWHVRRLSMSLAAAGEMLGRLVEADQGGRPPLPKRLPEKMKVMLKIAHHLNVQHKGPEPLLFGRHLLDLGFPPDPKVGEILRLAFDVQLNGEIHSLKEAKEWARKNCL